MKTADFLGTAPFKAHLQRRRTPRRILTLCLFSALCLGSTFAFELSVYAEEKRAAKENTPDPGASEAQAELDRIYSEMNRFAMRLDPLAAHLAQPACAELIAGLEEAMGDSVELQRVTWKRMPKEQKRGKKPKAGGPEVLVMEVDAIALDEETATALTQVLTAYTGWKATLDSHEPVPDRFPATRMKVSLRADLAASLPEVKS